MEQLGRVARDLVRINRRFLRDAEFRRVARRGLSARTGAAADAKGGGAGAPRTRPMAAPVPLPAGADIYSGLHSSSTALCALRMGSAPRSVTLVVPDLAPGHVFAGVRTALQAGLNLGRELDLPVRVVLMDVIDPARSPAGALEYLESDLGGHQPGLSVVPQWRLPHTVVSPDDVWIVTYWTTAHAADVARRVGVLDASRVVYLVQDYEPGFNAWSTRYALCRATYHAGFHLLVNSTPLRAYLTAHEAVDVPDETVFAPTIEDDRLSAVAARRRRSDVVRVFLYGRPRKPRNLYPIGVSALRVAVPQLKAKGIEVSAVSAGEQHADEPLGGGTMLRSLGTLPWDGYFDLLSEIDVGLSLQHSPHPSHPPLDLAVSGAWAVTNDFDGTRGKLHPRLTATDTDPDSLGAAIVEAGVRSRDEGPGPFSPLPDGFLGRSLNDAVAAVAARLG